jgi:hypothetical protein
LPRRWARISDDVLDDAKALYQHAFDVGRDSVSGTADNETPAHR